MNTEIKEKKVKKSRWKSLVLLFGGTVLIMIMVHAMQDAMDLQDIPQAKAKSSFHGEIVAISAIELQNEYSMNEDSATQKFKDKQLVVTGKIFDLDKYRTGESFFVFEKSSNAKNIKLQCAFKKESAIDRLSKGQTISIQGKPNFIKNAIVLENSEIKK